MHIEFPSLISFLAIAMPEGLMLQGEEKWYFIAGSVLFCLCGLGTGYFIWRRSHLQFAEMSHEKKRSDTAIERFRGEIEIEKKMLDTSESNRVAKKKKKKAKSSKKKKRSSTLVTSPVLEPQETGPIEPPENPVAKVMRMEAPKLKKMEDPEKNGPKNKDDLW